MVVPDLLASQESRALRDCKDNGVIPDHLEIMASWVFKDRRASRVPLD